MAIKISESGLNAIRQREELCLKAYKCQAGVWTIGWGHTKGVTAGMVITEKQAYAFLVADLQLIEQYLSRENYSGLNQNQYDALASLIFTIGTSKYSRSTLRRLLKAGAPAKDCAGQFLKWKYYTDPTTCEKKISQGLVNRRQSEYRQYLGVNNGDYRQ